jgi:hypothetical protein
LRFVSGVQFQDRLPMSLAIGVHAANEAKIIGARGYFRKKFADLQAALAVLLKAHSDTSSLLLGDQITRPHGHDFTMVSRRQRFDRTSTVDGPPCMKRK